MYALYFDEVNDYIDVYIPKLRGDFSISMLVNSTELNYHGHALLDDSQQGEGRSVDAWIWLLITGKANERYRSGIILWNWEDTYSGNQR